MMVAPKRSAPDVIRKATARALSIKLPQVVVFYEEDSSRVLTNSAAKTHRVDEQYLAERYKG